MSRADLASYFGVDQTTAFRWEKEGPAKPRMGEVAAFFGVSVEHMMGWDTEQAA